MLEAYLICVRYHSKLAHIVYTGEDVAMMCNNKISIVVTSWANYLGTYVYIKSLYTEKMEKEKVSV